jgi:hypothetical protein
MTNRCHACQGHICRGSTQACQIAQAAVRDTLPGGSCFHMPCHKRGQAQPVVFSQRLPQLETCGAPKYRRLQPAFQPRRPYHAHKAVHTYTLVS